MRSGPYRRIATGGAVVVVAALAFASFGAGESKAYPIPAGGEDRYWRTQAVLRAHAMAERIAANPAGAAAGAYDGMTTAGARAACVRLPCSPTGKAANDLIEWNAANVALLPSGSGTVARDGDALVITVRWTPNDHGATPAHCDGGDPAAPGCYRLRVER